MRDSNKTNTLVHPVGREVFLSEGVHGVVISISITGYDHSVKYECGWWSGSDYKTGWFNTSQVQLLEARVGAKIGFINAGTDKA